MRARSMESDDSGYSLPMMSPSPEATASSRRLHPSILALAIALAIVAAPWIGCRLLSDVGRKKVYGQFESSEAGAGVEIIAIQRLPTAWDGEERVYVRSLASPEAPLLEFDINGRFGESLRVDLSTDATWARIWLAHDPPLVGEQGWVSPGSGYFLDHTLGQTKRQDVFPGSVVAYTNLRTEFVLRYSSATVSERHDLLGLRPALPDEEVIRGETLHWTPTTHR